MLTVRIVALRQHAPSSKSVLLVGMLSGNTVSPSGRTMLSVGELHSW